VEFVALDLQLAKFLLRHFLATEPSDEDPTPKRSVAGKI
jgi:hypothetical protein